MHPLTVFFLFLAFITGYFQYIFYMMSLIFIHEIGHVTFALFFGWNVKKIILLPFGGMTVFEEWVNRPIKEEFLIVLAGPLYQHLFYLLLCILGYKTPLLTTIHYFILGFNLFPIYPLDGSKFVLLIFEELFSFYRSQYFMVFSSLFFFIILIFSFPNFLLFVLWFFLVLQLIQFYRNIPSYFYKFILERKLYAFSFKKQKRIHHIKEMKRDYQHYFIHQGCIYSEKDYLRKNWFT